MADDGSELHAAAAREELEAKRRQAEAFQNHCSLLEQLSELEAQGDDLPPDRDAVSQHLEKLEVCRMEVRIAGAVLQRANAALDAAAAATELAEWRKEHDLLNRRAETVLKALEKYHYHADAIVEMLAAAELVGNQLRMFCIRADRRGRLGDVNIHDPSWKTRYLSGMILRDLGGGQMWPLTVEKLSAVSLELPES